MSTLGLVPFRRLAIFSDEQTTFRSFQASSLFNSILNLSDFGQIITARLGPLTC